MLGHCLFACKLQEVLWLKYLIESFDIKCVTQYKICMIQYAY